jgi:predicted amidohydrolase
VAAVQLDTVWEDRRASFERAAPWLDAAAAAGAGLVVLPEMFACGFSMATASIEEPPDGPTTAWMVDAASRHGFHLAGSVPVRFAGDERPSNAFVLASPDGTVRHYRKRRPFTYAGEDRHYRAGTETLTWELPVEGADSPLRVTPFVCYDLRFADLFWDAAPATDAYLVVANWPEARRHHWRALATARAIENQAYVVAVNRVGDGGALRYTGDSRIVDPLGEDLATAAGGETMLLADLAPARVAQVRRDLPFLEDR